MDIEVERALRNWPENFSSELARIRNGAMNGGAISPRRHAGLSTELHRAKAKYDGKISRIRTHGSSQMVDEIEREIEQIAGDFCSEFSMNSAA